jgi:NTE family protein
VLKDLLTPREKNPGMFEVIANSLNIMQDRITRSRMAGDPPDLILTPHLSDLGLMEFDKAELAIKEGKRSVQRMEQALKDLLVE